MVYRDLTKRPDEIIVDLINADNGTTLPGEDLTFGTPVALSEGRNHNTYVIISSKAGRRNIGSTGITYNRLDLAEIPSDRSKIFEVNATRIADLIPAINAAYNVRLTGEDYIDGPLTVINGSTLEFDLVAAPTSLIFRKKVTLTFKPRLVYQNWDLLHQMVTQIFPSSGYFI